ncbi:MAG: DNA mismatch repair protein MutS, partial [Methanolinea sp.]|nr:DNA mismatch repair protein MutS [Methanolinea sp.]
KASKGIVKREVVKVITPGMIMDEGLLPAGGARYLMAYAREPRSLQGGLAFLDISTGEFFTITFREDEALQSVLSEVARYHPSECLVPEDAPPDFVAMLSRNDLVVTRRPAALFDLEEGKKILLSRFKVASLEGFGLEDHPAAIRAAGAALSYAMETQKSELPQVTRISTRHPRDCCLLDAITLRNLEVTEGIRGKSGGSTLLSTLDRTGTPMGKRLLRNWISSPLLSVPAIGRRLDAVEFFVRQPAIRMETSKILRRCADIERIAGRIAFGNAGPRDLRSLHRTIPAIQATKAIIPGGNGMAIPEAVREACETLRDLSQEAAIIGRALVEEPPATIKNGGVIRTGFHPELDELRNLTTSGKDWILALQAKERKRSGIKSLKIGYNSVFGYYIEVTKPNLHLVPPEYQRKQTTSTAERFTIPELKEKEAMIASAEDRLISLEQEIYRGLIADLRGSVPDLQTTAGGVAVLDVVCSFAGVAASCRYCRPVVDDSCEILVREGRHPVVEEAMGGRFVPNDVGLSCGADQILIITGANMAGKSTYMRSVALAVIMAQAGSFVPADYARIGVVDRIFTRVGAFDDLASGQSTFMVEMLELANILNHVTEKSLVILDEIGRGTSTLDGFCIARAVLEFLHGRGKVGARTLFATHFHDLVQIEAELGRVRNYHFAVKDSGNEVVFLRKIIPGATDKSYGIHVASLAGIPRKVTERARILLDDLSARGTGGGGKVKCYTQMLLVDTPEQENVTDPVVDELKHLELDDMTPLSALSRLYELQRKANKRGGPGP